MNAGTKVLNRSVQNFVGPEVSTMAADVHCTVALELALKEPGLDTHAATKLALKLRTRSVQSEVSTKAADVHCTVELELALCRL
eukprot:599063-Pelagomonas_calceolata.AAC.3